MTNQQKLTTFFKEDIRYVAHRFGYKTSQLPENSFEALRFIFDNEEYIQTISSIEFDINLTKDGHLVVVHDANLNKLSDSDKDIKDLTLEEFKQVNFTYREGDSNKNNQVFKAPTLVELFDYLMTKLELLKGKTLRIESKGDEYFDDRLITVLFNVLKDYPKLHQHIEHITFMDEYISEFDHLRKKYDFKIKNEKLFWGGWDVPLERQNDVFDLVGMDFDNPKLTNDFVKDWKHICFYTVNTKEDILTLLSNVDVAAFRGKTIYLTTDDYTELEKLRKEYN